ncbi:MAG: thioredoxin family protein [Chloroflexi bacterium]|nr:thioredoxin family protein [Chloroflexota bacterium]
MARKTSVVTPERFAKGFTFQEYLAQIKVNRDRFEQFYADCRLSPRDAAFFRSAAQHPGGAAKVLVLGEDWCPDVYRGLPAMVRIAEAGGMELRIFPRDQNLDIMDEFLNKGEFRSIPVAVFYTRGVDYLCHWVERPALANQERPRIEEEVRREMPGASDVDLRAAIRARTQPRHPAWQQESVREMRELLAKRLGLT